MQELTARVTGSRVTSSMQVMATTQAPQPPSRQVTLVPVSPTSSRRKLLSVRSGGGFSTVSCSPLSVNDTGPGGALDLAAADAAAAVGGVRAAASPTAKANCAPQALHWPL